MKGTKSCYPRRMKPRLGVGGGRRLMYVANVNVEVAGG